jgi:hypothetical protein
MTLDERFEFLARNIDSLHAAAFENTRQIAALTRKFEEQTAHVNTRFDRVTGMIEKLVEIAEGHERRKTRPENGAQ